ncbi:MAG TPA: hypothetical protein PLX77_02770 [Candidatus Cloacimonadota bacterium]|nr:hypothetical protein [Candidatus Cloacimonadota bacterium]
MYRFALYPSNHGFGHATRMAALAAALIDFGIYVYICTDRPEYLYESLPEDKYTYRKCRLDGGVVHGENLKADLPATRTMLLELFSQREELVAQETLWLRKGQIDLIIADIPYFIIEAAGYAEVPVFGLSNFDWVFIYQDLFADDPDMAIVINTIFGLYQRLDKCYVPSLGTEISVPAFRNPEFTGLLARKPCTVPEKSNEPILSIMFGGEGAMQISFDDICEAWDGIVLSTNEHCKAENHKLLKANEDFSAIIESSDLILCKPGYSTFAEILTAGKAMLYIPRDNYPEEQVLIAGVEAYPNARQIDSIPTNVQDWKKLFRNRPQAGKREEADNHGIAGRIMRDYLLLTRPDAKYLSVFDMGSNNLNYCLWDLQNREVIHKTWISTRLARSFSDGRLPFHDLSSEIEALGTLLTCDAQIDSGKTLLATGIMRIAENAGELLDKLSTDWQIRTKVISGKEEMRYAWYGAEKALNGERSLIFDIGGSSTELVWRTRTKAFAGVSLDLGLISLAAHTDPWRSMQEALKAIETTNFEQIVGVGLTATLLASLIQRIPEAQIMDKDGVILSKEDVLGLCNDIDNNRIVVSPAINDDTQGLYTMKIAAEFVLLILDKFSASNFMVCNDGISVGYARWKTK